MKKFSDLNISVDVPMSGEKIKIAKVLNTDIVIFDYRINESKYSKNKTGKCLTLQIEFKEEKRVVFSGSDVLINQILQVKKDDLPIFANIVKQGEHYEFQ